PVTNATVLHAIYDGYGSFLAKWRHPQFVFFLEVDSDRIDVNVHPMKREVRFVDQELVHEMVRQAVGEALGGSHQERQMDRLLQGTSGYQDRSASSIALTGWPGWSGGLAGRTGEQTRGRAHQGPGTQGAEETR